MEANKNITAVEWLEQEIVNQQLRYIELSKKDKTKRKEVDAILTATTLLKIKCGQAKEMEREQNDKSYQQGYANGYTNRTYGNK